MLKPRPAKHVRVNRFAGFDRIEGRLGRGAVSGIGRKPATFRLLGVENYIVAQHRKVPVIDRTVGFLNFTVQPLPKHDRRAMLASLHVATKR